MIAKCLSKKEIIPACKVKVKLLDNPSGVSSNINRVVVDCQTCYGFYQTTRYRRVSTRWDTYRSDGLAGEIKQHQRLLYSSRQNDYIRQQ